MRIFFLVLLLFAGVFYPVCTAAQDSTVPLSGITIFRTTEPVRLDGILDEPCWKTAEVAGDLVPNFPTDTGRADARTEVRVAFDQKFLYVSAICYQKKEDYTVQSLRRDFGPGTSDVINIMLSPFRDGLNGFLFSVNPLNVQREALIDNGTNASYEWDNRWWSAVTNEDDRWIVEMAIPFNTLRYKVAEGQNEWGLQLLRVRLKEWEVSVWSPVPRQYSPVNLNFVRPMIWNEAPPAQKTSLAIIPYVSSRYDVAYMRDPNTLNLTDRPDAIKPGMGMDAKIGITPSLNLDLTVNPDFSQVEVDRQVTNLSRFQLFFPERRQFFLENRDLFATFGFPSTRPFFSRRIGLADTSTTAFPQYAQVPILAGARLSGKINDNWRVGLLNMQTRQLNVSPVNVLPAANFTVATLQRKVFSRSAISGIFVDKENFLRPLTETQRSRYLSWNRVAGLEFNLYSKDNRWEGETYFHRSFSPDPARRGNSMAQFMGYDVRRFSVRMGIVRTDTSYTADAGFVPRPGVQGIYSGADLRFYPSNSYINTWGFSYDGDQTTDLHFRETDRERSLGIFINPNHQSTFNIGMYDNFTRLFEPFDPSNGDGQELPVGDYTYRGFSMEYVSSSTHDLQGDINLGTGQFYNGTGLDVSGQILYRWQPYGSFIVRYNYTRIRLPKPYASSDILLLSPGTELAFTRKLFLSAFFQYNTQANNFNINARLQWRYAPVSDLFLVYTDNSYAQEIRNTPIRFLAPKNKALVLKVVYWLNV